MEVNQNNSAVLASQYEEFGFVTLRNFFTDWQLSGLDKLHESVEYNERKDLYINDFFWPQLKLVAMDFLSLRALGDVVETLNGERGARFFNASFFVKRSGAEKETPWHQDLPYYPLVGGALTTVWIALDDAGPASGSMRYLAGSHRSGARYRPIHLSSAPLHYRGALPQYDPTELNSKSVVCEVSVRRGDCIVHDGLTLHSAAANRDSSKQRRAFAVRFIGPTVTRHRDDELLKLPDISDDELFPVVGSL